MKKLAAGLMLIVTLALSACGILSNASAAGRDGSCPAPSGDMEAYRSEEHGYCMLYPSSYTVTQFEGGNIRIEAEPVGFPHPLPPFASVEVTDAADRSVEQVADELTADFQGPAADFIIEREPATLGGEQAIVLDQMPGQDLSRQVIAVHEGRLYRLTFVTADETLPEYEGMQEIYDAVMASFTFTSAE
ncbi:MAG: hypothetical protein WBH90_10735 [Aggregatilineales bacterium]|jgi:hypothetical protein|nr:hypothetical protein [Chloroflexota bacterium]HOA23125.1 hypothetical protein [Aggregatilineales bacterium]HPV07870.1 hypothetical protein [Aggregatilineales bacterium]HQE17919.1 hypothetical protein [Aggregatilineales bacterium]